MSRVRSAISTRALTCRKRPHRVAICYFRLRRQAGGRIVGQQFAHHTLRRPVDYERATSVTLRALPQTPHCRGPPLGKKSPSGLDPPRAGSYECLDGIPEKTDSLKSAELHPKSLLPKRPKSRILATQFEPLKSVVEVAPLRRKWVAPYCRKLTHGLS